MDWVSLPSCQGYDTVRTFTDCATKMVHLVKARASDTALVIAHQLLHHVVRLHGLPRSLLSDRDPRLMSEVWSQLCDLLDVKRSRTSGYYPQANGQAERTNQNVKQILRVAFADNINWYEPSTRSKCPSTVLPQPRVRADPLPGRRTPRHG